jgi:hypothetical protein
MATHLGRQIAMGNRIVRQVTAQRSLFSTTPTSTTTTSTTSTPPSISTLPSDLPSQEMCDTRLAEIDVEYAAITDRQHTLQILRMDVVLRKEKLREKQILSPAKRLKRTNSF